MCNTSYESLCNFLTPNTELISISTLEFAQMPKVSFFKEKLWNFGYFKSDNSFFMFFFKSLLGFNVSSPMHMPIFMEILQTVIKNNLHEVGKTCFLVIPCTGQRKYSVSSGGGASSIAISSPFWTENRAQLSLFLSYNIQLAIILFSRTWPIYLCV